MCTGSQRCVPGINQYNEKIFYAGPNLVSIMSLHEDMLDITVLVHVSWIE